jgi:hypothetical protein
VDRHVFPEGAGRWLACASCHSEGAWRPSAFGIPEHQTASRFPLEGAHAAIPCVACHVEGGGPAAGRFPLGLGTPDCATCHETDDRHRTAYAPWTCATCHGMSDFEAVDFPHPPDATGDCVRCHDVDDPHGGEFSDRSCASCHGTGSFAVTDFDHSATRFPLDGAHVDVACRACHASASGDALVFRALGTECTDCHKGAP